MLTVAGEPILTYKAPAAHAKIDYRSVLDDLSEIAGRDVVENVVSKHSAHVQGSRRMIVKITA